MIGLKIAGGNRAEVGGSNPLKSLKSLGGGICGSSGDSTIKSLISLEAEAEVKHPSKLGVAALGGGPRFHSSRAADMEEKLFNGQVYRCVGTEPHTRADGSTSSLSIWESGCADCGSKFLFKSPTAASQFRPNRRCEKHRRRGVSAGTG